MTTRTHVAALALSASALVGIALHEGFRSRAYDDGVGVQTVGFGSTAGVKAGDTITVERALIRLADDVSTHEQGIRACIGDTPLAQREWDVALSLAFNIGVGAFCKSTAARLINAGDMPGACAQISRWDKAGGMRLPGLVKRRAEERRICENGL